MGHAEEKNSLVHPKPRKRASTDHIVIDQKEGGCFLCKNCGDKYLPNYPVPIPMMVAMTKSFITLHRKCKPKKENKE